jgi:DnaJ-class molecular chaperone
MPTIAVLVAAAAPAARHPVPGLAVAALLTLAAAIYATAYKVSVRRHPYRPCRKCGESGKHRGAVFTGSFRACAACGGTGRELRPFAREPGHRGH